MGAPTVPPASQPATQQITPPPPAPQNSQTIDESQTQISPQVKSLQRLEYELNADLFRSTIVLPLDVRVAAQQVVTLQNFGNLVAGNWLIEDHVLTLESSSQATSELIMRKCQNVDSLYNVPGPNPLPSGSSTTSPTSPQTTPSPQTIQ